MAMALALGSLQSEPHLWVLIMPTLNWSKLRLGKKMQLTDALLLISGAVIGVLLRYEIVESPITLGGLQVNVLMVNIIGSFILGIFSVVALFFNLDAKYSLLVAIGFCGTFTTMSSFALETTNLLESNRLGFVALNILANVGLSLSAVLGGKTLGTIVLEQLIK